MTDIERRELILQQLRLNYSVKVTELSKLLYIGEATIRRDLGKLEKGGYCKRVYGGAVRIDAIDRELPADVRQTDNSDAKITICAEAAMLIGDGSLISMDSSTTVQFLGDYLPRFHGLTVLTQGQKLLEKLQYAPVNVYCAGGLLQKTTQSYTGVFTRSFFSSFYADLLFFSCKGLSMTHGLSWVYEEEGSLRQTMMKNAKTRVLLCDHTKFDTVSSYKQDCFDEIDYLITDCAPSEAWQRFLASRHVELRYPKA